MLFLSGLQLLMIGVMGMYVGKIFEEVKQRPVYILEEELGVSVRPRRVRQIPGLTVVPVPGHPAELVVLPDRNA
jgi:hypothetical protein